MLTYHEMRERSCNFLIAFLHNVFMCGLNESFLSIVTPSSFSSLLSLIVVYLYG